jgi:hypothetical protein
MNTKPSAHFSRPLYYRCCGDWPRFHRTDDRQGWVAVCASCGQTATASHPRDMAVAWNRQVRDNTGETK